MFSRYCATEHNEPISLMHAAACAVHGRQSIAPASGSVVWVRPSKRSLKQRFRFVFAH